MLGFLVQIARGRVSLCYGFLQVLLFSSVLFEPVAAEQSERAAAGEAEKREWREIDNMPFPRLKEEEMDELEGTLDYPPAGSNLSLHGKETIEHQRKISP
ncbi:MAG: hypothetical protein QNI90_18810 [Dinoroseobacter sp.]|nr:hypothetical protein [Dinoroseobacter sp.]